jgi:hypothetical protein
MAVGFPTKVNFATGDVLTAQNMNDLSGTVNLLEGTQYAAGKNKIINGDFGINQRGFTSSTINAAYNFDRWLCGATDGTSTATAQVFAPGEVPLTGYNGKNFIRLQSTGQTAGNALTGLFQNIESVRTFAGKSVTVSFWAKASTGTPNIAVYNQQNFGSGGSPSATLNNPGNKFAITSSWVRYSTTLSIPSISGKTIGTTTDGSLNIGIATSAGVDRNAYTSSLGIQSITVDIWGVQVEEGVTASAFQTATGTIQGELAACQRYFQIYGDLEIFGSFYSATSARFFHYLPVAMRVAPAATFPTGTFTNFVDAVGIGSRTPTAFSLNGTDFTTMSWDATGMGVTTVYAFASYRGTNISYSAEL